MAEVSTRIIMGPVLSFRGQASLGSGKALWRVSAAILVDSKAKPPELELDGRAVSAPVLLCASPVGDVWRYDLSIMQDKQERRVRYAVKGAGKGLWPDAQAWSFSVPARGQAPRMSYVSCNGFSDPKVMKDLSSPADNVWQDLLCNHDKDCRGQVDFQMDRELQWHEQRVHDLGLQRFHVLLGGGDQIYMDGVWQDARLPELKDWVELDDDDQLRYSPSADLIKRIRAWYWAQYAERWSMAPNPRQKANSRCDPALNAGRAFASIPTVMMWDDHDIFDGWGSYSPKMQRSKVYQTLFQTARELFWVMQLQMPLELLPAIQDQAPGSRDPQLVCMSQAKSGEWRPDDNAWSKVRKADALSLPFMDGQPGFGYQLSLGPVALSVMDLRTERSQRQVMSMATWGAWRAAWQALATPAKGETKPAHVLVMSSVPVAHPKMSLIEGPVGWLASDNPTSGDADDLNDHWSHDSHLGERAQLVNALVALAEQLSCRVTLLSGDVHVAAWGHIERRTLGSNAHRINQLTSTAVVHPAPTGLGARLFLWYLNQAGRQEQEVDNRHVIRMMDFPGTSNAVKPARNWMALELDPVAAGQAPRLWASWRSEADEGFENHQVVVHPFRSGGVDPKVKD